jgi:integrase/recombinase XerD
MMEEQTPHAEMPLKAAITHFREYLRQEGKTPNTIKNFAIDIDLLARHTGHESPVGSFTTRKLEDFLDWMVNERGVPCSPKTYARRVTSLKAFFRWLDEIGAVELDPAARIVQKSVRAPLSKILTTAEIDRVLALTDARRTAEDPDARPYLLFKLLLDTGIKKSESVRIALEHLNPEKRTVFIHRPKPRNVYKERRLPLDAAWFEALEEYKAQYRPEENLFECTARNLEYVLQDVGEEAELKFKLSFEIIRWTCAVRDFREGVEPDDIRAKLGLSQSSFSETLSKVKRLAKWQQEMEIIAQSAAAKARILEGMEDKAR